MYEQPRSEPRTAWLVGVPMNLLLGVLAYLPLVTLAMLVRGVLESAGVIHGAPEIFRDGALPTIIVLFLTWTIFLACAFVSNRLLARRVGELPSSYGRIAVLLMLTPFALMCLAYRAVP